MSIKTRGIMLVLLTLLTASCVPRVEQPEVSLVGARLASLGLSGGVVDVRLSVYNPNRFGLRASGLTYDLDFEDPETDGWFDFTEGRVDRDLEVASGDTAIVVVPVEFTYRGLGEIVRGLLERGTFDYRVSGLVAVEGPVRRDIRYNHTGSVTPSGVR
ncbi:MAG TPA: LEA type 2 family protein [Longimicrobiales bacterium]|nr:LEA type 2 family protein [Longimicrobiales bacterium]